MSKVAVVLGGEGFIGGHLVRRLKQEGHFVVSVDIKQHEYKKSGFADVTIINDLRDYANVEKILLMYQPDYLFQLAADMGGAEYIFSGENDANVMTNSALINLNTAQAVLKVSRHTTIFYSSSACMYPAENQTDPNNPNCTEDSAYPAHPDSEYGWEKLFSERLYLSYARNFGLKVRIARFHNIFGPEGTWKGGKEKAPAALCRKVAMAPQWSGGRDEDWPTIEIFGDGQQTRSFLYVDECVEGILKLTESDFQGPVNIGSDEMISINDYAKMIINISGKSLEIEHVPGPQGVRGRNSDNRLIQEKLKWAPSLSLRVGTQKLFDWINLQVKK